jgi:hypothetical protein
MKFQIFLQIITKKNLKEKKEIFVQRQNYVREIAMQIQHHCNQNKKFILIKEILREEKKVK